MRIWDIEPHRLCRAHLLGEHRELHGLWNILTQNRSGYRNHPEPRRWVGRLAALFRRHDQLVDEMERRGFQHHSPLDPLLADGWSRQEEFVDLPGTQLEMLRAKPCACPLEEPRQAEVCLRPAAPDIDRPPDPSEIRDRPNLTQVDLD